MSRHLEDSSRNVVFPLLCPRSPTIQKSSLQFHIETCTHPDTRQTNILPALRPAQPYCLHSYRSCWGCFFFCQPISVVKRQQRLLAQRMHSEFQSKSWDRLKKGKERPEPECRELGRYPEKGRGQSKMNRAQATATHLRGKISSTIWEVQWWVRAPLLRATTLVTVGHIKVCGADSRTPDCWP